MKRWRIKNVQSVRVANDTILSTCFFKYLITEIDSIEFDDVANCDSVFMDFSSSIFRTNIIYHQPPDWFVWWLESMTWVKNLMILQIINFNINSYKLLNVFYDERIQVHRFSPIFTRDRGKMLWRTKYFLRKQTIVLEC